MNRLLMRAILVVCLLQPAGAVAQEGGAQNPDEGASTESLDRYSSAATWNWLAAGLLERDFAACGVPTVFALDPDRDPRHVGCIAEAMLDLGASPEAERFFEQTHQFLVDFQPQGPRVDLGRASVPWQNMGRGQSVFLNGLPRAMPIYALEKIVFSGWQAATGYAALVESFPRVFPWTEYSRLSRNERLSDGTQRIVLEFSMRECRACAEVAWMPVSFTFDTQGALVQIEVRPPRILSTGNPLDVEVTEPLAATSALTRVELDIFSGHPNPEWDLTAEQADELLQRLRTLPAVQTQAPAPAGLGYRGVIARKAPDSNVGFDQLEIANGVVVTRASSGTQTYADAGRALELWVLNTGTGQLDADVDQLIGEVETTLVQGAP